MAERTIASSIAVAESEEDFIAVVSERVHRDDGRGNINVLAGVDLA